MRLTASEICTYLCPSKCPLRIVLRAEGVPEADPGPYQQLLRELGQRHEQDYMAKLPSVLDLSHLPQDQKVLRTKQAVAQHAPAIHQGVLSAKARIAGSPCTVVGIPDFLILDSSQRYRIGHCAIARDIDQHPEIRLQLGLYGWLYEQVFRQRPASLEVYSGTGTVLPVDYDGGQEVLSLLEEIVRLKQCNTRPYCPVGWSKCSGCGFEEPCWRQAAAQDDVAIVAGIDQGLALALHDRGVTTVEQLLAQFDPASLSQVQRPWGTSLRRVGQNAGRILQMAQALASRQEILLRMPAIPKHPNYVMFDLEGLPPQMDELERIYLWGLQVFGQEPGPYLPALAGFGDSGDRDGWLTFLKNACGIFEQHGDIPFVHWHHYERTRLDMYVQRHGDHDGIAARVRRNLLDLLPITQKAVALPLPSYSLKVVERYIGFARSQEECGGDWAIARYIQACETQDDSLRRQIMGQILKYNEEDLAATWAVLQWLSSKTTAA